MAMKISLATVSLRRWKDDEFDLVLEHAKALGYEYIEPQTASPPHDRFDRLVAQGKAGELRQLLESAGLRPAVVYAKAFGVTDEGDIDSWVESQVNYLEAARVLGVRTVASSALPRDWGGSRDLFVRSMERLLPEAEQRDLRVAMEPHYGYWLQDMEDYDYVLSRLEHPNLGICPDTGHFHSAGVDAVDVISQWPARVFHIHMKDQVGKEGRPFGEGEIDQRATVAKLKEIGYDGFLSVELELEDKSRLLDDVRGAREVLQGFL
ncbi:MAG: sugar phosphate isomerase/epimerase [bacterium]|nr:sugar phosphate isomerase/epimerase [bacterium]